MMPTPLSIAQTQVGVTEKPKGSNSGPEVSGYLKSVGIGFPAAWCMAFVYWCHMQAGKLAGITKTGGVMAQWNNSTKYRVTEPKPGDVFIMDFGKGVGHTGFVEKIEGDKIHTIEGNTNDDGSREGYEVARRVRPIASVRGFLRFP